MEFLEGIFRDSATNTFHGNNSFCNDTAFPDLGYKEFLQIGLSMLNN